MALKDLERRFGKDVTSDVINREVFEAVMKFIEDNKLNVLGQPVPVEVKALDFSQKDFTFEYDLALAPELDIKLDKDEKIPYYEIQVSDEMVAEQDEALRKRFGAQVPGEVFEWEISDGTAQEAGMIHKESRLPFKFGTDIEVNCSNGSRTYNHGSGVTAEYIKVCPAMTHGQ